MKPIVLIFILIILFTFNNSTLKSKPINVCNNFEILTRDVARGNFSAERALALKNLVKKVSPLFNEEQVSLFVYSDNSQNLANSNICKSTGKKYILFNLDTLKEFIESPVGDEKYWKWTFLTAHEIAHLELNHFDLSPPCKNPISDKAYPNLKFCKCEMVDPTNGKIGINLNFQKFNHQRELQADFFASYALAKIGASKSETLSALQAINYFYPVLETNCRYPSKTTRQDVVERAWEQAKIGLPNYFTHGTEKHRRKFILRDNRDIEGFDLYSFPVMHIDHCAASCLRDFNKQGRCVAFSYDKRVGFCYLKHLGLFPKPVTQEGFSKKQRILTVEPFSVVGFLLDKMKSSSVVKKNKKSGLMGYQYLLNRN